MDRRELRQALDAAEIRRDVYSLDGGLTEEMYCLDQEGAEWIVYYSERGERSGLERFANEHDACSCLLNALSRDPGVRIDYVPPAPPPW